MWKMCSVQDLQAAAASRVPKPFFEYVTSGSWTQSTMRANSDELSKILFRQRVLRDISKRRVRSKMLGEEWTMPVALAPCGFGGMQWANGEILAAKAAEKFGVPFTLSTMSINSIEQVAEATTKPFWFQMYVLKDRDFQRNLLSRAKAAGCSALVLTVDLQVKGQRHADIKNGLSAPPKPTLQSAIDILSKPSWCLRMLTAKSWTFGNVVGHAKHVGDLSSLDSWTNEQFDPSLSWKDVEFIRNEWGGKFIIKGIMEPEDAKEAAAMGVDALVVSNHGGRQLDGTEASVCALPDVIAAVDGKCEVWLDGGIRSGQDVLRARALGASAAMMGRPWLYGLGAGGEDGVSKCLEVVEKELDLTMALCGLTDIDDVSSAILKKGSFPLPSSA